MVLDDHGHARYAHGHAEETQDSPCRSAAHQLIISRGADSRRPFGESGAGSGALDARGDHLLRDLSKV